MYISASSQLGCFRDGSPSDAAGYGYSPTDNAPGWFQEQMVLQQLLNQVRPSDLAAAVDQASAPSGSAAGSSAGPWSQAAQEMQSQAGQIPYWGKQAPLLFSAAGAVPVPVSAPSCTRKPFAYTLDQCSEELVLNPTSGRQGGETETVVAVPQKTNAWLIAAGVLGAAAVLG